MYIQGEIQQLKHDFHAPNRAAPSDSKRPPAGQNTAEGATILGIKPKLEERLVRVHQVQVRPVKVHLVRVYLDQVYRDRDPRSLSH